MRKSSRVNKRTIPENLIQCIGDVAWLQLYQVDEGLDDSLDKLLAPYRRVKKTRNYATPGGAWLQAQLIRSSVGDCCRIPLFLPFPLEYCDVEIKPSDVPHLEENEFASEYLIYVNFDVESKSSTSNYKRIESYPCQYHCQFRARSVTFSSPGPPEFPGSQSPIHLTFDVLDREVEAIGSFIRTFIDAGATVTNFSFRLREENYLAIPTGTRAEIKASQSNRKPDWNKFKPPLDFPGHFNSDCHTFLWFKSPLWTLLPSSVLQSFQDEERSGIERWFYIPSTETDYRGTGSFAADFTGDVEFGISNIPNELFIPDQTYETEAEKLNARIKKREVLSDCILGKDLPVDIEVFFRSINEPGTVKPLREILNLQHEASEHSFSCELQNSRISPARVHWDSIVRPWSVGELFISDSSELALKVADQEENHAHVQTYSITDQMRKSNHEAWWKVRRYEKQKGVTIDRIETVLSEDASTSDEIRQLEPLPLDSKFNPDSDGYIPLKYLVITDIDAGFRTPPKRKDNVIDDTTFMREKNKDFEELQSFLTDPKNHERIKSQSKEFFSEFDLLIRELKKRNVKVINSLREELEELQTELQEEFNSYMKNITRIRLLPRGYDDNNIEPIFFRISDLLQEIEVAVERPEKLIHQIKQFNETDRQKFLSAWVQFDSVFLDWVVWKSYFFDGEFEQEPSWWASLINWLEYTYGSKKKPNDDECCSSEGLLFANIGRSLPVSSANLADWEKGGFWDVLRNLKLKTTDGQPANICDKTVVVVSAHVLRACGARIAHRLSWEHATEDLWYALKHHPYVKPLLEFRYVVVRFGCAGAVLVDMHDPGDPTLTVLYDANAKEGYFRDADREGIVLGSNSTLIASMLRNIVAQEKSPDDHRSAIIEGLKSGIRSIQSLYKKGYNNFKSSETFIQESEITLAGPGLRLLDYTAPLRIFERNHAVQDKQPPISAIQFPKSDGWKIIEHFTEKELIDSALQYIIRRDNLDQNDNTPPLVMPGKSGIAVPIDRFGDFSAIERSEIESFRSIQGLLRRYIRDETKLKPLSIAVFGPPGSGKSFGVKAVATSLGENKIEWRTYNLSQFSNEKDLVIPFVKKAPKGRIPIFFFDEFDSALGDASLGWLKFLLQPMQDGEFKLENDIERIGKSVFVFAGGTSASFAEFSRESALENEIEEFRLAKGPDFVSRLSGYINMMGVGKFSAHDNGYVLRRGLIIRSILERKKLIGENKNALVDRSFLKSLLVLESLKHGTRSIEKLLDMCIGINGRLNLPSVAQLSLHLNEHEAQKLWTDLLSLETS
ncbi:ATPase family associated with various cellular activities (AAA) [Gimesia panareensis]|uniref:ATPase family associated with various cellular activities (AAA) n=1 Tax=Gimesia panareensis TaxID=2527978 RepID=A0A518FX82_9PLAN|nr:AAA family ATPase [Gimesia panareensis]QDV20911.1 ATPase family associated with various cellular activities (AAA) [Gimesia panareensis]